MPYVLLSAAIVLLDQWVKALVSGRLTAVGASVRFLPGLIRLTLVHNRGASWGILAGRTELLLAVTAAVCLAILTALLLDRPAGRLERLALAFVLGGAVGNAVDRVLLGYVVDMFETEFISFPVFNVADCFITVGALLFCLGVLLEEGREQRQKKEAGRARWEQSRAAAAADTQAAERARREFHDDDPADR